MNLFCEIHITQIIIYTLYFILTKPEKKAKFSFDDILDMCWHRSAWCLFQNFAVKTLPKRYVLSLEFTSAVDLKLKHSYWTTSDGNILRLRKFLLTQHVLIMRLWFWKHLAAQCGSIPVRPSHVTAIQIFKSLFL